MSITQLRRLTFLLLCLSLTQPFVALGQTNPPAQLPPAAQQALDKGITAAKLPDYLLAIRYFEEARKIAPDAPAIYFNLGVAESKIPSRELRAIAWFGAYLAAYPDAPNAAAVRTEIDTLQVRAQSKLSGLIEVLSNIARHITTDKQMPTMRRDKELILHDTAALWASFGDIENAQRIADLITESDLQRSQAYGAIASAQIEKSDVAAALRTAERITDKETRVRVQEEIAEAQTKSAGANSPESSQTQSAEESPTVGDWLDLTGAGRFRGKFRPFLRHSPYSGDWWLNTDMFLDLASHLKSLPPPSPDIYEHYWALNETASTILKAQREISEMLKAQFKK